MPVYGSARSVFASDLDRDGDLDLLSVADQVLAWHRNDGGAPPAFVNVIASDLVGGHWVVAVDMDGDGDQDPVVADTRPTLSTGTKLCSASQAAAKFSPSSGVHRDPGTAHG